MSQQSDIYSSSLSEGDLIATLTPLPTLTETLSLSYIDSDGPIPFISEPHISQQSFTSAPDSNFVQSLLIPSNLTRIWPNHLTEFVLYTSMDKEVFVNWWLQTTYGKRPEAKTFNWDRTGHLSDVWKHFDQISSATDGLLKVKCQ